jgi:hypothetical protein
MPAGATLEGLPQARYPVSKTGGSGRALGVRFPLLPPGGMAEREGSALLRRRAACRLAGSSPAVSVRSGVVESVRHAVVTRESAGSSPAAGALRAPVVETG